MLKKLKYTGGSCSLVILELGCEKKLDATRKLSERFSEPPSSSGLQGWSPLD